MFSINKTRVTSLMCTVLGMIAIHALPSQINAMEYEVQLKKVAQHNSKQANFHHQRMHARIVLGPKESPTGMIEFYGKKGLPEDVKAEEGETQHVNLGHQAFPIIFGALINGANISTDWDEVNEAGMISIQSE